jgi:hypothetical protein
LLSGLGLYYSHCDGGWLDLQLRTIVCVFECV